VSRIFRRRPKCLPFARAFRSPAFTRSTMRLRSSSATAPNTVKTILPAGVEVSICSEKETKSIPRALTSIAVALFGLSRSLGGVNPSASTTTNCATLPARGQRIGERGGSLARRRYQKGRVFLRGKKNPVWVERWREDKIENGQIHRPERSAVLGSKLDLPTKRLALRELEERLVVVNEPRYRARPTATFAEFASRWESLVLTQHKPSTQITIRSHLRRHLVPYLGRYQMREIGPEEVQRFVSSVKLSAKTAKNLFATMQMLWKSARVWGYVAHDAVSDVVLNARVAERNGNVERRTTRTSARIPSTFFLCTKCWAKETPIDRHLGNGARSFRLQ